MNHRFPNRSWRSHLVTSCSLAGRKFRVRRWTGICLAGLLAISLTGCSRSPEPDSATPDTAAAPPTDDDLSSAAAPVTPPENRSPTDPPGGLELPADFSPERETQLTPSGDAGGFEMPSLPDGVQAPAADTPAAAAPAADAPAAAGEVSLQAAPWDEIAQAVSRTGKVTVVDVWSLACDPCIKEFPGLVAIHRDLGDQVACFSVDTDYDGRRTKPAESYRPDVEKFLKSMGATFTNYLSETPSDELFAALEISSIPAVLIFDADGKLVRTFSDVGDDAGFTYAENIRPFVEQLLAENR